MLSHRWLLALPLAFAVTIGSAAASSIRDDAGLFSPDAVREAEAKLNQVEREMGISTTIETIASLQGEPIGEAAIERARATHTEGLFILIPKQEHRIWVLASKHYTKSITGEHRKAVEQAFISGFKKGDFDAGLKDGTQTIARELTAAQSESGGHLRQAGAPPVGPLRGRPGVRPGANSFGLGSLLGIGLLIVAVLVGIRLIGSLFGGGRGAYGPGAGAPGMGPGYGGGGPGYGPGYGGRGGGGIFSSILGGLGGAMAGNWLYDQFSGRNHGGGNYADTTGSAPDAAPTSGGDEWGGGAGTGGDWGGGDAGGDGGGGGDWGGGGGGDWGGGGGGDWGGGGGGDGGSW